MATELPSAHHRLLLASISHRPVAAEAVLPLLEEVGADWERLESLALQNRLLCFVALLVERPEIAERLDGGIVERWRELRRDEIGRIETKLEQLREIGEGLERAGIEGLVYKGPDFHQRLYTSSLPRSFNDLDLLLRRREDVAAAVEVLEEAGYSLPPDTPPLAYYLRFHLHAIYLNPEGRHPVEVHWALDSPYSGAETRFEMLFEGAEPAPAFGPALLRPGPIDALGLMVLHLEKHLALCATLCDAPSRVEAVIDEGGLLWVLDVVRWFRQLQPSEPTALLERLRRLAAERALVVALRLAHDVDPEALSGWTVELAERLPASRPLASRLLYPDLRQPLRSRLRRFLTRTLPVVTFKPARIVEVLLPPLEVPGVARPPASSTGSVRRLGLGLANLCALAWWKIGGYRLFGRRRD